MSYKRDPLSDPHSGQGANAAPGGRPLKNLPPKPECPDGYPRNQLVQILGERIEEFDKWTAYQTCTICDGWTYNYKTREQEPSSCKDNPHGIVVYGHDLERFLAGLGDAEWAYEEAVMKGELHPNE